MKALAFKLRIINILKYISVISYCQFVYPRNAVLISQFVFHLVQRIRLVIGLVCDMSLVMSRLGVPLFDNVSYSLAPIR